MIATPWGVFDTAELEGISQFVAGGGGLLVLGNGGLDPVKPLTLPYNIIFDSHYVLSPIPEYEGNFLIYTFADHQATRGVPYMSVNWGERLIVGDSAVALAMTSDDAWQDLNWNGQYDPGEPTGSFTMAAAYEGRRGRVVAVSDNGFQDAGFEWFSNDLFMRSLLRWLTRWHPIYTDAYTDLADFADFASHWLETGCGLEDKWCYGPDLNGDGDVDFEDLKELAESWLAGL